MNEQDNLIEEIQPTAEDYACLNDLYDGSMVNDEDIGILYTAGLEEDTEIIEAPVKVVSKPNQRNKSSKTTGKTDGAIGRYNRQALANKYPDLPNEGPVWPQLNCLDVKQYKYAVIKPEPEYDNNSNLLKYKKVPTTKWHTSPLQWDSLRNGNDYAVVVEHPYILVDIDDELEAKAVFQYIKDKKIKCLVMRTDRGLHFWFKLPEEFDYDKHKIANDADQPVMGGITVDYRINSKGLATVKFRGNERHFIYGADTAPSDWDSIPIILYHHTRINSKEYEFVGMTKGSRDSKLTNYKAALYGKELLSVEECAEVLNFINSYLFVEPLSASEMAKFSNQQSYANIERYDPETEFYNKNKFLHEKSAAYLNKHYDFIPTDNKSFPLIYKDGYYQNDPDGIEILLRKLVPELTTNQIDQVKRALHSIVTEKIRNKGNVLDEDGLIREEPYWVNLNNGRLNMLTGEFTEHSPAFLDTQRVPVTYEPKTVCDAVDTVLNNVFEGDQEKIKLFYEIVGTCLTRDNRTFIRSFYFVGEGANGKSTLIRMLVALIGIKNICCVKPGDMKSNSFNLIELHHKLANIVEELSATDVSETDVLKQVIAGDTISANRKYLDPVTFRPYCTVIYAMNKIPNFTDKSLGMTRRYEILTFTKNFNKLKEADMASYDPHIADKITTEEAKSYLLNKAVEAYRALVARGEYTIPQSSRDAKDDYLAEENPVIAWIDDYGLEAADIVGQDSKCLYNQFKDYQTDTLGYSSPWMYKSWKAEVLRYFSEELAPVTRRRRLNKEDRNSFKQVFEWKDAAKAEEDAKKREEAREAKRLEREQLIAAAGGFVLNDSEKEIPF